MSSCSRRTSQTSCGCKRSSATSICCHEDGESLFTYVIGPTPDETLLALLDRVLYLAGATKISLLPSIGLPLEPIYGTPCATPREDVCRKPPTSATTICSGSCRSEKLCKPSPNRCVSVPKPCNSNKRPRQRTTCVDFSDPVQICQCSKRQKHGLTFCKRFQLCAMKCCGLRRRLASGSDTKDDSKWLWTRLIQEQDGCKKYEVYKNSNLDRIPGGTDFSNEPIIIFLVTPNGYIMPFETISK